VTGWKSCRCAVPSFRDCSLGSATSHSASFLKRPHDLKFKTDDFSLLDKFIGVLKIQLNGAASRPMA
jgi:hypothetical protein